MLGPTLLYPRTAVVMNMTLLIGVFDPTNTIRDAFYIGTKGKEQNQAKQQKQAHIGNGVRGGQYWSEQRFEMFHTCNMQILPCRVVCTASGRKGMKMHQGGWVQH